MRLFRILRSRFSTQFIRADLYSVLHAANSSATLDEKIEWLESLIEWVRLPASPEAVAKKTDRIEASRVRFLLQMLERKPDLYAQVSAALQSILLESDSVDLYFSTGIELQHGFSRELTDRTVANLIPKYREANSLKQTFEAVFASEEDIKWFRDLSDEGLGQIMSLAMADPVAQATFRAKQLDSIKAAMQLLVARVAGLVVEHDLRVRLPSRAVHESPFFQLQSQVGHPQHLKALLQLCWQDIESVYKILESAGVSVDLVYKMDSIKSILRRIDLLSALRTQIEAGHANSRECMRFIAELADLHVRRASLTAFLSSSLNLIARKIVERASQTGEHYITRTREEFREMFLSATGGGFVTMFTTVLKVGISKLQLPLFFDGLFAALNYSVSFTIIQVCQFTLATKTPAPIASALAGKLRDLSSQSKVDEFVEEVVCIHRTAFAAVIGNLGMVIPSAVAFDLIWTFVSGAHFFSESYGLEQFKKHSPLESFTIWYAIVTGFLLWCSSVMGGWVENWFVYRKQFEVFEKSLRIRRYFGATKQQSMSAFLRHNIAGFGTNVFLGLMLAYCGVIGRFFGIPLEVRHVTLSTGTLTFSMLGLTNPQQHIFVIISALVGIVLIGVLNFAVSFTASLFVAARARDIRLRNFPFLVRLILSRFRSGPRDFYFPSKI